MKVCHLGFEWPRSCAVPQLHGPAGLGCVGPAAVRPFHPLVSKGVSEWFRMARGPSFEWRGGLVSNGGRGWIRMGCGAGFEWKLRGAGFEWFGVDLVSNGNCGGLVSSGGFRGFESSGPFAEYSF